MCVCVCVCVCVSGLTVGLRLLYFGGAGHAPSIPHYYVCSPFVPPNLRVDLGRAFSPLELYLVPWKGQLYLLVHSNPRTVP